MRNALYVLLLACVLAFCGCVNVEPDKPETTVTIEGGTEAPATDSPTEPPTEAPTAPESATLDPNFPFAPETDRSGIY